MARSADRASRHPGPLELALPLAVGLAAMVGSTTVGVQSRDTALVGAIMLLAAVLAVRAVGRPMPVPVQRLVAVWVLLVVVYAVASLGQAVWSARYVAGDLALSLLPLAMLLGYLARRDWLLSVRGLRTLLALLLVAALTARVAGVSLNRHEAPSSLLIAGVWYLALEAGQAPVRWAARVAVPLVGLLAYSSGYRTAVVLWALAPAVVLLLRGPRAAAAGALTVALLVVAVAQVSDVDDEVRRTLEASRFQTLVTGAPDQSLETRTTEVHDVARTAQREWLAGQWVVGYGFGATYVPDRSYVSANVVDGRVHHVHVVPVLTVFRFGALGALICLAVLAVTLRTLSRTRRTALDPPAASRELVAVAGLGVVLYSLESLMLNATVQPGFSWCLAIVLASTVGDPRPRDAEGGSGSESGHGPGEQQAQHERSGSHAGHGALRA